MVQEQVEPVILREGDEFYTLPSDADSLIEVIDTNNVKVEKDKVHYKKKLYSIQVGQDIHHLVLIGQNSFDKLLDIALQQSNQNTELEKKIKELEDKLVQVGTMLLSERKKAIEANQRLKKIEDMRDWDLLSIPPLIVVKEMWNSGKISLYSPAVPPTKFKSIKYNKKNKPSIDYWVALFEEWGLIDSTESQHYKLLVTWNVAKKKVKDKIGDIQDV